MRDQLRSLLRDQIISGELKGGVRLEEVTLSTELGVSRTPLREALLGLTQEGLVISRPHRGFMVAPADPDVVRELYPILGTLEALVVESSIEGLRPDIGKLRKINARMGRAPENRAIAADRAFHAALRARCPNLRLFNLLATQEIVAHRLDGATRRGMADIRGSQNQHSIIIDAIERGDARAAGEEVREHWRQGAVTVLKWMEQNDVA